MTTIGTQCYFGSIKLRNSSITVRLQPKNKYECPGKNRTTKPGSDYLSLLLFD